MRLHGWQKWVLLTAVAVCLGSTTALRCVQSGTCSLGQLQPFTGDIGTSEGLKAALAARSFNRELIVMVTTPDSKLAIRSTVDNFARLGMEHIMLISWHETACKEVSETVPNVGCVWESRFVDAEHTVGGIHMGVASLWRNRYRVLARATRMGYNVLLTDSDVVVWDDPYRYFKAPPFDQYHVINQPEVLYDQAGYSRNVHPNGGFIYVQNIRPDGPTAYMLAETELRFLRWADDNFNFTKAKGISTGCLVVDQEALLDALSSVAVGRPLFMCTVYGCWTSPRDPDQRDTAQKATSDAYVGAWQLTNHTLPGFMHPVAGKSSDEIKWLPMVLPHTEGVWPEEYGGQWYPLGPLGPHASHFLHLLGNDTDSPLWPDPEDPATLSAARAGPKEQYAYAPPWLVFGYWPRGSTGVWLPDKQGYVQQVIGHSHYLPETDGAVSKQLVKQMVGYFDWRLAHELAKGEGVFFANRWSGDVPTRSQEAVRQEVPRLLVVHPRIYLARTPGYPQLYALLRGAMQVAALSNRTLVWPDLPCVTSWVGSLDADTGVVKHVRHGVWFPWHARSHEGMRCMFTPVMRPACLYDGRGMMGTEWHHYRERWGVRHDLVPHAGNTAFFPVHGQLGSTLHLGERDPTTAVVSVSVDNATSHLRDLGSAHVVYLAHPVQITGLQLEDTPYAKCLAPESMQQLVPRGEAVLSAPAVEGWVVHGRLQAGGGGRQAGEAASASTTQARRFRFLAGWRGRAP